MSDPIESDSAKPRSKRLWEIDVLRGVAIIMMVSVHVRWDMVYLGNHGGPILLAYGFWRDFARATASIFMFLVGLSLTLSYERASRSSSPGASLFPRFLKRGLMIFGCGMAITLVTGLASIFGILDGGTVYFGILHFIGLSILLAYPFLRLRTASLWIGVLLIVAGTILSDYTFSFPWLLWLGFVPEHISSVDYYPLLPWFGVVLLGVFAGNTLYPRSVRAFRLRDWSRTAPARLLGFLGRHSLLVYLVHQPLFLVLLGLTGLINLGFW